MTAVMEQRPSSVNRMKPDAFPAQGVPVFTAITASETAVTWSASVDTGSTSSDTNPCNGIIRWYEPVTGRWLSNDPIGISGGLNQYVFCGNCPTRYRDPFGLCKEGTTYQPRIQIQDAQEIMERHYNNSLKQWGLWNKFFGGQDIKYMNDGDVFMYQGKIIGSPYMGNMAVGYTAYRNYGYLPAIWISVLGEYGWPDLGNVIGGMEGSFDANANGIAEGMLTEHYGPRNRIRLADRPGGGSR